MPVTKMEILNRGSFANGESFGDVGPYEQLDGIVHFSLDPLNERNTAITDLELAPRDSNGKVVFSSEFTLLKPIESGKGNRRLFFDVINRGRKTAFGFNDVPSITDHTAPLEPGNGFLMRQGYAVMFCGWQSDLPDTPGLLGMQGQEALIGGRPIEGKMLCQFQANAPTQTFLLSDQNHAPHPALDIDEAEATLTVRDLPNDPPTPIDRGEWSFIRLEEGEAGPDPCHVYMPSGFQPGRIYQLVYTTKGSSIVGLGFAAVRDSVSFIKYAGADAGNPLADAIDYAYAVGRSQSGRFLRQMIHAGLNEDEEERMTLDGIIPHVAGAMRGEFNLRFGQPSKDVCFIIPELFPFTDTHQVDPVTGAEGSMLERLEERGKVPKIMFINTSAEYWRGDAALIHTDLVTMQDAPQSPNVRRYHFAGCQHGTGDFPPIEVRANDGARGQLAFNSVNYNPLFRAALTNLDKWVSTGEEPPASRHPNMTDGTAMDSQEVMDKFLDLPGVRVTPQTTKAMRLDYGPELSLGRTVQLPASEGETYPALVSDIDENFNERGGIRLPDLTVPVATYTGWNLRDTSIGNPNLFIGITGGLAGWTLRFPVTPAEREATGDPRLSIEERYASREDYLRQVQAAAERLVEEGYMLAEDIERAVDIAGRKFDYFTTGTNGN